MCWRAFSTSLVAFNLSYREKQLRRFDHQIYDPVIVRDKTICVVGAGGIGQEVAKLCAAAGMRVIGTRRRVSFGVSASPRLRATRILGSFA